MLLASTFSATTPIQYPQISFRPAGLRDAARALFQALYVSIFTDGCPCAPTIPTGMVTGLRNSITSLADANIRDALAQSNGRWTTRLLMSIAIRSGLYEEDRFAKSLCQWVIIAHGDTYVSDFNDLTFIPFNEYGDLYSEFPDLGLPNLMRTSAQALANLAGQAPFYRWLSVITRNVLDSETASINLVFDTILPLVAAPLDPVFMMTKDVRIPLSNFVNILTHIQSLYPNGCSELVSTYDVMRSTAWNRFYSYGHRRFLLSDPLSAQAYFNTYIASLPPDVMDKCPALTAVVSMITTLASVNSSSQVAGLRPAVNGLCGSERGRIQIALEAAELISEQAVDDNGDGSAPDANATDPATSPGTDDTRDQSDEEDGNDPMSTAMKSGNVVNNNSIGETSSGSKLDVAITPADESGNPPSEKSRDYLYRMAVNTLNSRLREEPDFDVPASGRDSLESWCRYWLWILPVESTKKLMKELGLQPLLSPLD